jgi:16S rRNA (cytidine1402-2'-O)-methyltransferase
MGTGQGRLFVVATPIGNLDDISSRALEVLRGAELIAAEDTRHSRKLLAHYGIVTPLAAFHEHNERHMTGELLQRLAGGSDIALISDAGTPLISDPGFHLVREARTAGARVIPIPGPSALLCALSAAGLPTDRFVFEGFLPAREVARRGRLELLAAESRTLVFYESPHRIVDCLRDMAVVFGPGREAVVARELTKLYETIRGAAVGVLAEWISEDSDRQKGEFVIVVHGASAGGEDVRMAEARRVLALLLEALPLRQAVEIAVRITGCPKNSLYEQALRMRGD